MQIGGNEYISSLETKQLHKGTFRGERDREFWNLLVSPELCMSLSRVNA